ncbi:MAG: UvrD-helicase domain-containing protein [bacterium]|nr:UvrD-helicase domain-containing protein [bacterium]
MDLLEKLNENQKEAVLHTDGPLLILAGAGSGKTRVITHRIAHLINDLKIPPYNIFAVTFTNKAAEEMKNRVIDIIGPSGNSVFMRTFHSAAVFILRRYGDAIGIPQTFSIYDMSDQQSVIKDVLLEMRLDPKKIKPSMVASKISEIKDKAALMEGDEMEKHMPDYFSFNFSEVYSQYHKKLAKANALDFNDLLIKTVELFRNSPKSLQELQRKWRYFMVDEYQDTNYAQYLIAKYLAAASRNLCVVGDDDQSIYSWRGADIRNILDFEKDYEDAGSITLEHNYRSTEPILKAASAVILNNINRKEKKIIAARGEGEPAVWCQTNNEYGEAEYVVNSIISHKNREGLKNKDFAVFYRTNAQSRVFEDRLRKENIRYRVVGGRKFYDRKEIKDVLAYLRFIINPADLVSLIRIINTPARGIGKATVSRIREIALKENISEWTVINDNLLTGRVPKGMAEFRDIISGCMDMARSVPRTIKLSKLVNHVLKGSGYKETLEEENTIEGNSRLENIEELINSVIDYEIHDPDATLDQFLQDISLLTSEENPDENVDIEDKDNVVTLMTVHNAKGLEFPVVYLTGMEEDTFPHKFSLDSEEGIEEERRLCYVGITRAMEQLYITNAELRRSYSGTDYRQPSRFINEIPRDLIEIKSFYSEETGYSGGFAGNRGSSYGSSGSSSYRSSGSSSYGQGSSSSSSSSSSFRSGSSGATGATGASRSSSGTYSNSRSHSDPTPDSGENQDLFGSSEGTDESGSKFQVREKVIHPKFGLGLVLKIEGSGDNTKLTITFGGTRKTFLEKYTPLERVN